jgi:predicted O-methyltransferase YrrM
MTLDQIKANPSPRDEVFKDVISFFNKKVINILEIGSLRSQHRNGDGWSTIFLAEYVNNHGGFLTVSNINADDLNFCKNIIQEVIPEVKIDFVLEDGLKLIEPHYDFVYLDGGDDPQDTLNQFNLINKEDTFILVDDFHTKGSLLPKDTVHTFYNFTNGYQMALYYGAPVQQREVVCPV